ncbi:phosphodiester glycosidase family protein [Streptomyces sp. YIM 98790]|uniref:phosphodiester glycosidase family protein n=1 Tax=Streptomyces sp. YIM 98790 TaxID=2689077 RepID=UPI00140BB4AE|nr:phosphodiester glycosidase family protein [Streptomyces sp. YIM 98790]
MAARRRHERRPGPGSWRLLLRGAAVAALALGLVPPAVPSAAAGPARIPSAVEFPAADPLAGDAAARATAFEEALGVPDAEGLELSRRERTPAPGVGLTSVQRREADAWLNVHQLTVDLGQDLSVDHLGPETLTEGRSLSELTAAHRPGPGRATVAAFNADFFDINVTEAPLAPGVRNGELLHSGTPGRSHAVGIDDDGTGRVLQIHFAGKAETASAGEIPLAAYNSPQIPEDGIGVFTDDWGAADRALTVRGSPGVTEVLVEDGEVTSVSEKPGSGPLPEGVTALLGRDAGAAALAGLAAGDRVALDYSVRTDDGQPLPRTAVGGQELLVSDGRPHNWEGAPNNLAAPRTAVGFSRDGRRMFVLVVDGRQAHSGGVTLTRLAGMMQRLGAWEALNLDGGGSATLLAREPGDAAPRLVNSPSDGRERAVPNGLAVTAPTGSGDPAGITVRTVTEPALAPTAEVMGGGRPERVFPGLTRALSAVGHDETYGPAPAAARDAVWSADGTAHGRIGADGVFTAGRPGTAEVRAAAGGARGSLRLTVIGHLARLTPTQQRIGLSGAGDTAWFGLLGHDATGTSAPVEPADVTLEYDRSLFAVEPDPRSGGFLVTALAGGFTSGRITATAGGVSTVLGAGIGLEETVVADFENAGDWRFSHSRAAGAVSAVPDGHAGTALRLSYDFTLSEGSRTARAAPPADIPVAGRPSAFALWVHGDGRGAWPALHLLDATGTSRVLRGPYIEHQGWRRLVFEVPDDVPHPVSVHRFYLTETRPPVRYQGEILIDELTALTPQDIALPEEPGGPAADPVFADGAAVAGRDWRFAVLSDAGLDAGRPDGEEARGARAALAEAQAAGPELVVINGDWVAEGTRENLLFARELLTEELTVPWVYVPGDAEVRGGSPERWGEVFGESRRVFDHRGTRFLTLDTSSRSVSGGGLEQWLELRTRLLDAARDKSVGAVAVIAHVPPRDTSGRDTGRLTDRMDALLLEQWLTGFRAATGKGVTFLGGQAGLFDAYLHSGVPYVLGGGLTGTPSVPEDRGGVNGWTLVGVDRLSGSDWTAVRRHPHRGGPDWLSAEVRPAGAGGTG